MSQLISATSKLKEFVDLVMTYPYKRSDSDCHRTRLLSNVWHHADKLESIIFELQEDENVIGNWREKKNEE